MSHGPMTPLAVDLDGTLISSDLLMESFLGLLKRNPFYLFLVPLWLLRGKAFLKEEIALRAHVEIGVLPYRQDLLAWLHQQKAAGRDIYLATASHHRYADAIANHLGIFSGVFATRDGINLSGAAKKTALEQAFGTTGWSYAGNAPVDLKVWQGASSAVVVGKPSLARNAGSVTRVEHAITSSGPTLRTIAKALRVHQWVKNLLIAVPLLAAHRMTATEDLVALAVAFFAFSFCASSVYVLNDMLDLADDRSHPTKCKRPFASGSLALGWGILMVPLLLAMSAGAAWLLPPAFGITLVVYYVLTVAYSFGLKRLAMFDVIVLAVLYTMRIIAGAAAVEVPLSFWLLAFSMFIFLSLAILKRYTELLLMRSRATVKAAGRGYHVEDISLLAALGGGSGYIAVLVLALYINSPEVHTLYSDPQWMWPACIVMLFWISRAWMIAHRGDMHDDPIVFAIKDPISVVCALVMGGMLMVAS